MENDDINFLDFISILQRKLINYQSIITAPLY